MKAFLVTALLIATGLCAAADAAGYCSGTIDFDLQVNCSVAGFTYTGSACVVASWRVLTLSGAELPPSGLPVTLTYADGRVGVGGAIVVRGPPADQAANSVPFIVTVTRNVFELDAALRFTGSLPPSSVVTLSENVLNVTRPNPATGLGDRIVGILLGDAAEPLTLWARSQFSVLRNAVSAINLSPLQDLAAFGIASFAQIELQVAACWRLCENNITCVVPPPFPNSSATTTGAPTFPVVTDVTGTQPTAPAGSTTAATTTAAVTNATAPETTTPVSSQASSSSSTTTTASATPTSTIVPAPPLAIGIELSIDLTLRFAATFAVDSNFFNITRGLAFVAPIVSALNVSSFSFSFNTAVVASGNGVVARFDAIAAGNGTLVLITENSFESSDSDLVMELARPISLEGSARFELSLNALVSFGGSPQIRFNGTIDLAAQAKLMIVSNSLRRADAEASALPFFMFESFIRLTAGAELSVSENDVSDAAAAAADRVLLAAQALGRMITVCSTCAVNFCLNRYYDEVLSSQEALDPALTRSIASLLAPLRCPTAVYSTTAPISSGVATQGALVAVAAVLLAVAALIAL